MHCTIKGVEIHRKKRQVLQRHFISFGIFFLASRFVFVDSRIKRCPFAIFIFFYDQVRIFFVYDPQSYVDDFKLYQSTQRLAVNRTFIPVEFLRKCFPYLEFIVSCPSSVSMIYYPKFRKQMSFSVFGALLRLLIPRYAHSFQLPYHDPEISLLLFIQSEKSGQTKTTDVCNWRQLQQTIQNLRKESRIRKFVKTQGP